VYCIYLKVETGSMLVKCRVCGVYNMHPSVHGKRTEGQSTMAAWMIYSSAGGIATKWGRYPIWVWPQTALKPPTRNRCWLWYEGPHRAQGSGADLEWAMVRDGSQQVLCVTSELNAGWICIIWVLTKHLSANPQVDRCTRVEESFLRDLGQLSWSVCTF